MPPGAPDTTGTPAGPRPGHGEAESVPLVEERVAFVVAITASASGMTLLAGLVAGAWSPGLGAALLRWGCAGLLAVPLARNAAILLVDRRPEIRGLTAILAVLLAAVYAVVLLREAS